MSTQATIGLPPDSTGKLIDAYTYSGAGGASVYAQVTVPVSSDGSVAFPPAAALADARATPVASSLGSLLSVYNGATWDLARSAAVADATTGRGLLGVGALGWDGTNFRRLATDSSGHLAVSVSSTVASDVSDRSARLLGHVSVDALPALPAGTNAIGTVSVSNFPALQPVAVSNLPATQPVSASSLPLPSGAAQDSSVQSVLQQLQATLTEMQSGMTIRLVQLYNLLARPPYYDSTNQALKVNLGTAGNANSNAVLGQLSRLGGAGFDAATTLLNSTDRNLWQSAIRQKVT